MTPWLRRRLARTPPGYRYSIGRILLIYSGLMLTIMLAALDQTIVATALPSVVSDIGGFASYSWVFSAYLLFQTVAVPVYGKLGDVHGRRPMLIAAITIFVAGSALCGLAQTMGELIVFRSVQGLGAGGLTPLAFATIGELIPPRDRGRYQGLIAAAFGSASVIGPAVGGFLVDHTTWRWIFYVNLPIGVLALAVVALTMPKPIERLRRSVDYSGALLLAAGTGGILLGLIWGGGTHPWISPQVLGALAASVIVLGLFTLHERRVEETILPFAMLRSPTVAAGAACVALVALCRFGLIAFVPLFAQEVIGTSATSSGVVLTPLMLGGVVASVASGQWTSRTGRYRSTMLVAPLVLGAGAALLWRMDIRTTAGQAARDMFVCGLGVGLMMPLFIVAAQNAVPQSVIGACTGFLQFSRSIGTAFGATVFGVIVNQGLSRHSGGQLLPHRLPAQEREALASAIRPAFVLAMALCVLVFLVVARYIRDHPLRPGFDEHELQEVAADG